MNQFVIVLIAGVLGSGNRPLHARFDELSEISQSTSIIAPDSIEFGDDEFKEAIRSFDSFEDHPFSLFNSDRVIVGPIEECSPAHRALLLDNWRAAPLPLTDEPDYLSEEYVFLSTLIRVGPTNALTIWEEMKRRIVPQTKWSLADVEKRLMRLKALLVVPVLFHRAILTLHAAGRTDVHHPNFIGVLTRLFPKTDRELLVQTAKDWTEQCVSKMGADTTIPCLEVRVKAGDGPTRLGWSLTTTQLQSYLERSWLKEKGRLDERDHAEQNTLRRQIIPLLRYKPTMSAEDLTRSIFPGKHERNAVLVSKIRKARSEVMRFTEVSESFHKIMSHFLIYQTNDYSRVKHLIRARILEKENHADIDKQMYVWNAFCIEPLKAWLTAPKLATWRPCIEHPTTKTVRLSVASLRQYIATL